MWRKPMNFHSLPLPLSSISSLFAICHTYNSAALCGGGFFHFNKDLIHSVNSHTEFGTFSHTFIFCTATHSSCVCHIFSHSTTSCALTHDVKLFSGRLCRQGILIHPINLLLRNSFTPLTDERLKRGAHERHLHSHQRLSYD